MNIIQPHRAITYLSRPKVANTIGIALFGSRSRELVKKPTFVDVPLDTDETIMLLALRFAHLQLRELKDGDTRDRFADALRMVQSETVAQVQQRRRHAHRPMPAAFGELGINLTRPNPRTPLPSLPDDMSQADAVGPLVVVALSNVIEPFEIKVDTKVRQQAMTQLCQQMQLGSDYGIKLLEAVDEARKVLQPKNWARWAAWGLGSAAIVTATGGVALAAAPGVAGAAAVTSALAAFGPGGMLGGLLTAGTLLTGGGVATGIAASSTTAEAAEALAEAHLAAVIFRDRMGIAQDDRLWADLMENKADVARRLGWLSSISDDGAPDVKVLQQKYDILERAVAYVNDHDLLPDGETDRLDT
ncbi:MAG: hypothetical protein CSA63_01930 [Propionibacterium sp.]|nr:MAG: hypothetical protein CSA63_01930 [Propionibacterium sp.]